MSSCLFDYPAPVADNEIDSPCVIDFACKPLKASLISDHLDPDSQDTWDYCDANGGSFVGSNLDSCISCLQASNDQAYMSNCKTHARP